MMIDFQLAESGSLIAVEVEQRDELACLQVLDVQDYSDRDITALEQMFNVDD